MSKTIRALKQASLTKSNLQRLFKQKSGIRLDLGCGENKQAGFVGLDKRKLLGVDIVHDIEVFPYPIPDDSCFQILSSHVFEHVKPWLFLQVMDECWRIMKLNGQLLIALPYGVSHGFVQDPTHCNPCNETTWQYFDPQFFLYQIYKPKPWKLTRVNFFANGNMEVIMEKREDTKEYHIPGVKV